MASPLHLSTMVVVNQNFGFPAWNDALTVNENELQHMNRAVVLAQQGEGFVEPNPMVGCVVARHGEVLAEGWHRKFGVPHAEVDALSSLQGIDLSSATLYVTLEPCCHQGKTPPCTEAVIESGVGRVVVAMEDPSAKVAGNGIQRLRDSGVEVCVGVAEEAAQRLVAPFVKLTKLGRPWVMAKWAATLDGRIATRFQDSQWISSESSRAIVHKLRGRVDAILVGIGTAAADDPMLIARPAGARMAARIVIDSSAKLSASSRLVQSAKEFPLLLAIGPEATQEKITRLESLGVEVWRSNKPTHVERIGDLLDELGRRQMTNLMVEGGSQVFGGFFDAGEIDEVHAFVAPQIVGGIGAVPVISGVGKATMQESVHLRDIVIEQVESDMYLRGRVEK